MKLWELLKWKYWDYKHPRPRVPSGCIMYVASPHADDATGSGKTLSVVEVLDRTSELYDVPVSIFTNFQYAGQTGKIESFDDILNAPKNSIFAIDEAPRLFNSRKWASFPIEMFSQLAQNRKENKQFLLTAQFYDHADKNFRDFARTVVECRMTWGNRMVRQSAFSSRSYKKVEDSTEEEYRASKLKWQYNFVAGNDLFERYDTLEVVKMLKKNNEGTA